jgi:hypothetical protein
MAIDTAEKRRSISFVVIVSPGVTPNSTKDTEWRREVGYAYPFGVDVLPEFEVDYTLASIYQDDVGLHLMSADLAMYVAEETLSRKNILSRDVGWHVIQESFGINVKEG